MDRKEIFKYSKEFIGGKSEVFAYYNKDNSKSVDIMTSKNTIYSEVEIHSSIGLSDIDIGLEYKNKKVGVELIAVGDKEDEIIPNILGTIAFEIMDQKKCDFGQVIPNVISMYDKNYECKHAVLLSPNYWEKYKQYETKYKIVSWLLIVPITDSEKEFIEENGIEAFENILSKQEVDITNRKRKTFIN